MRHPLRYRLPAVMALATACILPGCASMPEAGVAEAGTARKTTPRTQREHMMQAAWRGRSYFSLLEKFGPPKFTMTHPGRRTESAEIVLYGVRDFTSNCIDAFTVVEPGRNGDRIVADYFCR